MSHTTYETRLPIRLQLPVLWGDMDAYGHVNNTVYIRWFESARIRYMEQLEGFPADAKDEGPILAQTDCQYRLPVAYPDNIEVRIGVSETRNTSFKVSMQIWRLSDQQLAAEGSAVMVWYDYRTQKSIRIPDLLRSGIERIES